MKKWLSVLLGAVVAFAMPASAFATDNDDGGVNRVIAAVRGDATITIDGKIDPAWNLAERAAFKDGLSGMEGHYRMMWDEDNLYVLVELHGAAKAWKDAYKPVLFSLWYNGDTDSNVNGDGYIAVSWPDMQWHDNGLHLGWFKPGKIQKAFAVSGDDLIIELKLPWEHPAGVKLSKNTNLGLFLRFAQLGSAVDANGQLQYPIVTDQVIKALKPSVITDTPLHWVASLLGAAADVNAGVDLGTGGNTGGNTGGSTGGNTGGSTGGSTGGNTGGSTGGSTGGNTGGNTGGSTGGTGTGGVVDNGGGTAVGGVTDEGVIPGGMPRTGGGGASDWTD